MSRQRQQRHMKELKDLQSERRQLKQKRKELMEERKRLVREINKTKKCIALEL